MEKIVKLILTIIAFSLFSTLPSCDKNETKQKLYCLGEEYEFETIFFKSELSLTDERFSFDYKFKEENKSNAYFSFEFRIQSLNEYFSIKDNFKITDSNDKTIVFDEYNVFSFNENSTFYVSFKDSQSVVKDAILSDDFSINVSGKTIIPKGFIEKNIYSA